MMDKISDVTRQDIIDVIRNGFEVFLDELQYDSISSDYVTHYTAKIPYYGRLDELGFLERLYDLDNMPSNDSRYSNAHGDISCHLRFGDYEDEYLIFQDERFSLRQGDGDEALLHFLCMMLHPAVRIENSQWRDYLQKFNELLREDGYELYPAKKISGRDIYEARPYIAPPKITWPENLFSERYKELIEYGNGPSVDHISGVVNWDTKRHFSEIMIEFRQPIQIQPNRYESRTERTDALEVAIDRLRDYDIGLVVDLQYAQFLPGGVEGAIAAQFTPALFDIIELQHDELSDDEKAEYRAEINAEFTKSNLPFQLNAYGLIEHTAKTEVLSPEIIGLLPKIQEPGLCELLETAITRHQQPDFQSHRDAVEKIWDVLERLKTYYTDLDKKASVNKIINDMAGGQSEYQDLFEEEFRVLTNIGNRFCIRHHETNKINITDIRHCDYFFNRCLSLIALALQYLK